MEFATLYLLESQYITVEGKVKSKMGFNVNNHKMNALCGKWVWEFETNYEGEYNTQLELYVRFNEVQ